MREIGCLEFEGGGREERHPRFEWNAIFSGISFVIPRFAGKVISVLEGRRIASGASRGRKVRTPQGAMPRNLSLPTQEGIPTGYTRAESRNAF